MALGAAERQAEPDGAGVADAIEDSLEAILFLVDAALVVGERLAVIGGREPLLGVGSGSRSPANCSIVN